MFLLGAFNIILITSLILLIIYWIASITSSYSNKLEWGFISYRKFKKLYNSTEWKIKRLSNEKILIKETSYDIFDDSYELFVAGATYNFDNKTMLAITPIDLLLINNFIGKRYKELAKSSGHEAKAKQRVKF